MGPSGKPRKVAPPTIAMARGRSSGVNITGSTASDSGVMTAAARPSETRAAMSWPLVAEYAQARDDRPNKTSAPSSRRLRPYRSPSRPAGSNAAARTRL